MQISNENTLGDFIMDQSKFPEEKKLDTYSKSAKNIFELEPEIERKRSESVRNYLKPETFEFSSKKATKNVILSSKKEDIADGISQGSEFSTNLNEVSKRKRSKLDRKPSSTGLLKFSSIMPEFSSSLEQKAVSEHKQQERLHRSNEQRSIFKTEKSSSDGTERIFENEVSKRKRTKLDRKPSNTRLLKFSSNMSEFSPSSEQKVESEHIQQERLSRSNEQRSIFKTEKSSSDGTERIFKNEVSKRKRTKLDRKPSNTRLLKFSSNMSEFSPSSEQKAESEHIQQERLSRSNEQRSIFKAGISSSDRIERRFDRVSQKKITHTTKGSNILDPHNHLLTALKIKSSSGRNTATGVIPLNSKNIAIAPKNHQDSSKIDIIRRDYNKTLKRPAGGQLNNQLIQVSINDSFKRCKPYSGRQLESSSLHNELDQLEDKLEYKPSHKMNDKGPVNYFHLSPERYQQSSFGPRIQSFSDPKSAANQQADIRNIKGKGMSSTVGSNITNNNINRFSNEKSPPFLFKKKRVINHRRVARKLLALSRNALLSIKIKGQGPFDLDGRNHINGIYNDKLFIFLKKNFKHTMPEELDQYYFGQKIINNTEKDFWNKIKNVFLLPENLIEKRILSKESRKNKKGDTWIFFTAKGLEQVQNRHAAKNFNFNSVFKDFLNYKNFSEFFYTENMRLKCIEFFNQLEEKLTRKHYKFGKTEVDKNRLVDQIWFGMTAFLAFVHAFNSIIPPTLSTLLPHQNIVKGQEDALEFFFELHEGIDIVFHNSGKNLYSLSLEEQKSYFSHTIQTAWFYIELWLINFRPNLYGVVRGEIASLYESKIKYFKCFINRIKNIQGK
ncbi:hypothetical protein PPACK8108_LOCUS9265 [Phakopsora pachyrhizi]|uniref:Uncharacterized protein n=1 Tax=Phakopsora pachyrhizi TaxID=170000 RepID=A0AAV0AYN6_PHAPC|nr:hypothetical protein PPACK8108_LOCUS9265 [Phakopsora pachyrhizi]